MDKVSYFFFTLIFCISILGMIVSGILYFINRNKSVSPRLLAGYLVMISITSLHVGLSFTSFYQKFPHLWRSTSWSTFCAPALGYLYVRSVLHQQFRLRRWDWLLFIPAVLYTLSLGPYYLQNTAQKLEVVNRFMADTTLIAKEPEGWLPQGWGVIGRLIFGLALITAQYIMLAKMRGKLSASGHSVKQNEIIFRWLFTFTTVLLLLYVVLVGEHIFHLSRIIDLSTMIFFTISGTILFISLYLLARPTILYGFQGWLQEPEPEPEPELQVAEQHLILSILEEKKPFLTIEQGMICKEALENYFASKTTYLQSGYKIRDLSVELDIPIYLLSAFINQEYGKNFSELINEYRLNYLSNLMKSSSKLDQFTIDGLGKEVGFNSRNSFITAVRKKTGLTPAIYFSNLKALRTA